MALYKFIFFLNWLYASRFNFIINDDIETIDVRNIEFRANDDRTVIILNFFHPERIENSAFLGVYTKRKYSRNASYENPSYDDSYDTYSIVQKADAVTIVGDGNGYYKAFITVNTKDFHPQWA